MGLTIRYEDNHPNDPIRGLIGQVYNFINSLDSMYGKLDDKEYDANIELDKDIVAKFSYHLSTNYLICH